VTKENENLSQNEKILLQYYKSLVSRNIRRLLMEKKSQLEKGLLSEFKGKKILVTGGSGSIGKGIIIQLLKYKPNNIRILSNDENSIFELRQFFGYNHNLT